MNDPKKLNGWTGPMMVTLAERYLILFKLVGVQRIFLISGSRRLSVTLIPKWLYSLVLIPTTVLG